MEEENKDQTNQTHTLPYEEMPVVETSQHEPKIEESAPVSTPEDVVPEAAKVFAPSAPSSVSTSQEPMVQDAPQTNASMHTPRAKPRVHMGTILFVLLLFGLGVWLSSQVRSLFSSTETTGSPDGNNTVSEPQASASAQQGLEKGTIYSVTGVAGRILLPGVTYTLPIAVASPVCDGTSCASSGTNLPGGTRFTVAARGANQVLPDFRGAILTDVNGREFTMAEKQIGTHGVYEYSGAFTGVTGGGYSFTRMRGVLIPISDTQSVEMNHFAPVGVASDFQADDTLFEQIVSSLSYEQTEQVSPTRAPSATSSATQ